MLIIFVCFCALAFANPESLQKENSELRKTRSALVKAVKQLTRETEKEASVGVDAVDAYGECYMKCHDEEGGTLEECDESCSTEIEEQVAGSGCTVKDGQPSVFASICAQQKKDSCLWIGVCTWTSANGEKSTYEKPICSKHALYKNEEWCDLSSNWMSKCDGCKYGYFWGGFLNMHTYCCKPADLSKSCYCA